MVIYKYVCNQCERPCKVAIQLDWGEGAEGMMDAGYCIISGIPGYAKWEVMK